MKKVIFAVSLFLSIPVHAGLWGWACALLVGNPPHPPVVRYSAEPLVVRFHTAFAPSVGKIVTGFPAGSLFSSSNIGQAFGDALDAENISLLSYLGLQRRSALLREAVEVAFRDSLDVAMRGANDGVRTVFLVSLFNNRYYHSEYPAEDLWLNYSDLRQILYDNNEYARFLDFKDNLLEENLFNLQTPAAFAALIRNLSTAGSLEVRNARQTRLQSVSRTFPFQNGVESGLRDLAHTQRGNPRDINLPATIRWIRQNLR